MSNKVFIFLILLAFLSCSNNPDNRKADASAETRLDLLPAPESEEKADEYEEQSLDFFNPIGVIGTGVIQVDAYNDQGMQYDSISLYDDQQCKVLYSRYDFVNTYGTPKGKNIIPLYNKSDYGYYCFVCVDRNTTSYEVAINKDGRKFVKKEPNIRYYNWEEFFGKVFYIDPAKGEHFRTSPDDNAEIIEFEDYDDYELYDERVTRLSGEWLHLYFPKAEKEAWVRWKRGNDIIVQIYTSA